MVVIGQQSEARAALLGSVRVRVDHHHLIFVNEEGISHMFLPLSVKVILKRDPSSQAVQAPCCQMRSSRFKISCSQAASCSEAGVKTLHFWFGCFRQLTKSQVTILWEPFSQKDQPPFVLNTDLERKSNRDRLPPQSKGEGDTWFDTRPAHR